jgi:hypothetical protein
MKVLFSLRFSDIRETLAGTRSIFRVLGLVQGINAINYASLRHFAKIINNGGSYPEKGKRRVWFKLHYLKHVYDYLKRINGRTADDKIDAIIREPSLAFIGRMIPDAALFSREFVLNQVWPYLVARDYNIEGEARAPSDDSASLHVRRCFYHEVAEDVGLMDIADRMCFADYIFWENYHPNVRFSRTKTLIDGDDHCDHTLTWVENP